MNLYEATKILKQHGFKCRKLTEANYLDGESPDGVEEEYVTVKFRVNRKRHDYDKKPEYVTCMIQRPRKYAEKISCDHENYDDTVYERFCQIVPDIVYNTTGLYCSPDWFFEDWPEIVEA